MSIVFAVGSEEQLRVGVPWVQRFVAQTGLPVHAVVVGADRKVLKKHAESTLAEAIDQDSPKAMVTLVDSDPSAILDFAKSVSCRTLLMIHSDDVKDLQLSVFEKCPCEAIWLRTTAPPPSNREQVWAAISESQVVSTNTCERILGLIPNGIIHPDKIVTDQSGKSEPVAASDQIASAIDQTLQTEYTADDVIAVGVINPVKNDPAHMFAKALIGSSTAASVMLISDGDSFSQSLSRKLSKRIQSWVASVAPPMERDDRVALVENLESGSKPNLEFLGLISAASMLAAFGLLQDSAAVIIGAMLIAPLMTPILGAGLSLTHGNRPLFRSSLLAITLGFFGAIVASMMFGWLVIMVRPAADKVDWITPEMWARCRPSPLDFCVGFVGGIAAAYAQTRRHLSAALAGAAIAAALVPPLSTAGLQIAFGIWWSNDNLPEGVLPVAGPLLLVTINVLMIMLGASFVLWARGMRRDRDVANKSKWTLRVIAILFILALSILVAAIGPEMIFPSDQ